MFRSLRERIHLANCNNLSCVISSKPHRGCPILYHKTYLSWEFIVGRAVIWRSSRIAVKQLVMIVSCDARLPVVIWNIAEFARSCLQQVDACCNSGHYASLLRVTIVRIIVRLSAPHPTAASYPDSVVLHIMTYGAGGDIIGHDICTVPIQTRANISVIASCYLMFVHTCIVFVYEWVIYLNLGPSVYWHSLRHNYLVKPRVIQERDGQCSCKQLQGC